MHNDLFKFMSNMLLFVVLLMILVIPIGTVTYMTTADQNVLSAQEEREFIQTPREQILRNNAIRMTEEKQPLHMEETEETTESGYPYNY